MNKIFGSLFLATVLCLSSCNKDEEDSGKSSSEKLTFTKLTKEFVSGGKFSTTEILGNVKGTKSGYTLKEIKSLTPSGVVTVDGTKPDLSLSFKKAGNFTGTLVLEHKDKEDATIEKAAFSVTSAACILCCKFGG